MTHKQVAIVGGGIGGLTLAIALQRKGFHVKVYEKAPRIQPLGAGLVLAANAVKALYEIGIGDDVLQAGKILKTLRIKNATGEILTQTNSEKLSQKFGIVNNFTIHRADLHRVLINQLLPDTLKLDKDCIDFTQRHTGVTLTFLDGTTSHTDYLIASDGIHSSIRKKLIPNSHPRYAGYTCWRAVIDNIPANVDVTETSETWGQGCRFGIVPLSENRLYWFACVNASEKDKRIGSLKVEDLLQIFNKFHFPVTAILKNTKSENLIWSDISDLKPLTQFAFGNVVLIGDAAHATTPNMGQGACMAIEDAAVLSNCITSYPTIEEAFSLFQQRRIKRTTAIVNMSRAIGKVAQLENPFLIRMRNLAMKLTPTAVTEKQIKNLSEVSFR